MSAPTKPPHITDGEWVEFQLYVTWQGACLNEINYDHWWAEFKKVKEISGED
jgi:hypothetical protein